MEIVLRRYIVALRDQALTESYQAIPQITNDFNSLPDVGWYGSAYLLTCCSFQLLFGKFYTLYAVKTVLLTSIVLFEVGSVVCGAAPNSAAFIVGRAIAGVGAAGIFAGTVSISPFHLASTSRLMNALRLWLRCMLFLWKNAQSCRALWAPYLAFLRLWDP
jgi:MFS family permease